LARNESTTNPQHKLWPHIGPPYLSEDRANLGAEQLRPHTCHSTAPLGAEQLRPHKLPQLFAWRRAVGGPPAPTCVAGAIGSFSATKAFEKRRKIKKVLRSLDAGFNAVTLRWPHRQKNQGNLKAPPHPEIMTPKKF